MLNTPAYSFFNPEERLRGWLHDQNQSEAGSGFLKSNEIMWILGLRITFNAVLSCVVPLVDGDSEEVTEALLKLLLLLPLPPPSFLLLSHIVKVGLT